MQISDNEVNVGCEKRKIRCDSTRKSRFRSTSRKSSFPARRSKFKVPEIKMGFHSLIIALSLALLTTPGDLKRQPKLEGKSSKEIKM